MTTYIHRSQSTNTSYSLLYCSKETEEEKSLSNKQMMVINGAYRILKDSRTRAVYDIKRRQGFYGIRAHVKEGDTPPPATSAPTPRKEQSGTRNTYYRAVDNSFFEDMFGAAMKSKPRTPPRQPTEPPKPPRQQSKIRSNSILEEIEEYLRRQSTDRSRAQQDFDHRSAYASGPGPVTERDWDRDPPYYSTFSAQSDSLSDELQSLQVRDGMI